MSVVSLILILCFLGLIGWLVYAYAPFSPGIKKVINIILLLVAVIITLQAFGVWDELRGTRVPHI